jgi:hypothetical protein
MNKKKGNNKMKNKTYKVNGWKKENENNPNRFENAISIQAVDDVDAIMKYCSSKNIDNEEYNKYKFMLISENGITVGKGKNY